MTNADEFSELIRTGELDFALLKPIDTQFLISLQRVDWSSLGNFLFGLAAAGVTRWCSCTIGRGRLAARALSALRALRRGHLCTA